MNTRIEWTTPEQRRLIIDEALGLLERHGIRFGHGDALKALAEAGAHVDRETGVARIPSALVEDALARCPREFVLGGATPEHDCLIEDGVPHHVNSGATTIILTIAPVHVVAATVSDLREATSILDVIPDSEHRVAAPDDHRLRQGAVAAHPFVDHACAHAEARDDRRGGRWQVPGTRRMAEAAGGDLRTRPRVSVVFCTASPLQVHPEMLDAATDLAAAGLPLVVMSMPIAGGTTPITVAGSVTVGVAEILGTMTAIKLRAPEAKLFFSMVPGLLDMRQTTFAYGALEAHLQAALAVEIGHDLGLPVQAPWVVDRRQAPRHPGRFREGAQGTRRHFDRLRPDDRSRHARVGQSGVLAADRHRRRDRSDDPGPPRRHRDHTRDDHGEPTSSASSFSAAYLKEKETRRRLRAGEQFLPLIADRSSYDHWQAVGKDELAVACERVEEILAAAQERGSLPRRRAAGRDGGEHRRGRGGCAVVTVLSTVAAPKVAVL